ncbi:hypothetical protein [Shewanella algae]|uniref:hypothetical protein n=1 Tax=Shewanella algae TaxID=38313 RepID=UPI0008F89B9B|nr:hypothetical protein BFS86_09115 [Shewanella algae]
MNSPFLITVHSVDNTLISKVVSSLNSMDFDNVVFTQDMALDFTVRGLIDLSTYIGNAKASLEADLFLYIDVDPKLAAKRLRKEGIRVPQNTLQLMQLRYREWASIGAEQEKCFRINIDEENLTVIEIERILKGIIEKVKASKNNCPSINDRKQAS